MGVTSKLKEIREFAGSRQTVGLPDNVIEKFEKSHPQISKAVDGAYQAWSKLKSEFKDFLKKDEADLIACLQDGYINFYKDVAINPYVPLFAAGPWVVTSHGAVVHDSGGYGMLGLGHGPENVLSAMSQDVVMANIMTASFSQKKFMDRLRNEVGHNRSGSSRHPFAKFLCLNSGSEAMTVACRISDINTKNLTDPGGRHQGKPVRFLSQVGSFHGRTEKPALMSHSSHKSYQVLASFRGDTLLDTIDPGNIEQLRAAFAKAEKEGFFYEAMFIEPVMGEGNPGMALSRQFYDEARRLTKATGTMLVIDSIQAGLRATGSLSICDYPGFTDCDAPDLETYSKALNAGQYPLSVLALSEAAATLYKKGVYGNTMTTNPRVLEVACAVLDSLTPALRKNIVDRGTEFTTKFENLKKEFPGVITKVQGTGLLFSVELNENGYTVLSKNCVELDMRQQGIGVIHGGKNALRFTPHFGITSEEIDLVVDGVRRSLAKGPIYKE